MLDKVRQDRRRESPACMRPWPPHDDRPQRWPSLRQQLAGAVVDTPVAGSFVRAGDAAARGWIELGQQGRTTCWPVVGRICCTASPYGCMWPGSRTSRAALVGTRSVVAEGKGEGLMAVGWACRARQEDRSRATTKLG